MRSVVQIRLLVLSVAIVTVSTLPVFLTGAAFFQIGPELGLGPLGLGTVTALFFLTASATSPRLGRWVQRVGWRRAMRINVLVSAMVSAAIAPLAQASWSLAMLLMAGAVMYGAANPAANQALARYTHPDRNATVFGLKHAGIPASTLLAGLAVPVVVVHLGWRPAFLGAGLLALAVWLLIPGREPEAARFAPVGPPVRPLTAADLRRLAVVAGLGAVAAVSLGTFMVSAAVGRGVSESAAGWLQFGGSGTSILARVGSGLWADRRGRTMTMLVSLLAFGSVVFALIPWSTGALFAVAVLAAYATGWGWPGLMTASVVGADRKAAAASSAITQAGIFVGAGGSPLILGAVVDRWSFSPMWLIVSACLMTGAAVGWSLVGEHGAAHAGGGL